MLTENTMRTLSKLALAALLISFVAPAFAQGTSNTSITVEQPWSRATPKGAKTGAVYMTLDNKSGTADRLTGASSNVADKLQIHEMKVENGVMQMREVPDDFTNPMCTPRRVGHEQYYSPNRSLGALASLCAWQCLRA